MLIIKRLIAVPIKEYQIDTKYPRQSWSPNRNRKMYPSSDHSFGKNEKPFVERLSFEENDTIMMLIRGTTTTNAISTSGTKKNMFQKRDICVRLLKCLLFIFVP